MIHMTSHRNYCNQREPDNNNSSANNSNLKSFVSNLRCPFCKNICSIILEKENYSYSFRCNYCSNNKNQNNDESINNYYKLRNNLIENEYTKNSDFFCKTHPYYNFQSYCKICNINICERCCLSNVHRNHEKEELNSLIPEENEVFAGKINLRKNKEKYEKIIKNIINTKNKIEKNINLLITRIKEFYKLEEFIIKNYKVNILNKNYYYLQNFLTINKNLEINLPLIDVFISNSNFENRSRTLIEIINNFNFNKDNESKSKNNNNNNNNNNDNNHHNSDDDNSDDDNNNNNNKNNIYLDLSSPINRTNNKLQIQNMKKGLRNERNINEDNGEYKTEKINMSLDNTFEKNEKLKGNVLIKNEFFKLVKTIDNGKNRGNKDNNVRKSISNSESKINNFNNYSRDEISNDENNLNNNNLENAQEQEDNFKIKKESEVKLDNIIRSIEFLDEKKVLICNSTYLKIYEIDDSYNLNPIYSTKEIKKGEECNINYATVLKNGNIIICSTCKIFIIKLKKINSNIIDHTLIQEMSTKGENMNKVIEIPNKSSIIACDKKYITKFKKNNNIEYKQVNMIKIDSESKCIEYINDDVFAAVYPKSCSIAFYDIDAIHNNYYITENINAIHGRYVISNVDKLNCIFFAGSVGVYAFSNINYKLISIYYLDYWISAISYNFEKDCLICGGVSKIDKNEINNKGIDLIIIDLKKNELEEYEKEKKQFRIEKIENICEAEITAINCLHNKIFIGSRDQTIQLYNY